MLNIFLSVFLSLSVVFLSNRPADDSQIRQATHTLTGVVTDGFMTGVAQCSATAIAPHVLLTAAHCEMSNMQTDGRPGTLLLKVDHSTDLMLVYAPNVECPCVPVSPVAAKQGTKLVAMGFPFGMYTGYVLMKTEGEVMGFVSNPYVSDMKEFEGYMVASLPIEPGNSGGGIFVRAHGSWYLVSVVSHGTNKQISISPSTEMVQEFLK